jgi:hypothetical protein
MVATFYVVGLIASGRLLGLLSTPFYSSYAVIVGETILCACSAKEANRGLIRVPFEYRATICRPFDLVARFYVVGLPVYLVHVYI